MESNYSDSEKNSLLLHLQHKSVMFDNALDHDEDFAVAKIILREIKELRTRLLEMNVPVPNKLQKFI